LRVYPTAGVTMNDSWQKPPPKHVVSATTPKPASRPRSVRTTAGRPLSRASLTACASCCEVGGV